MGAYGYILVMIGFFQTFVTLGADNAYARYFFEYKTHKEKQILTTTLFSFFTLWVLITLILPFFYINKISLLLLDTEFYSFALLFALLSIPLRLLSSLSNQALRNQFKTKQFVIYNLISAVITVGGAIVLLIFSSLGIGSIFVGMIIADMLVLPLRIHAIKELFIKNINFSILKKILAYGIPFIPASIAYWIFSSADRIMLESMCSLESVGTYTVAVSLSSVMSIFAGAIGQAWSPHAIKIYEENKEEAKILYAKFLNVLIAVALLIVLCAAFLGKEIIEFLFPREYNNLFYPMLLLLTGIGFQITVQVTAAGISLAKKTIYLIYITFIIAGVNIALNYILIPLYQETGASIATAFSFFLLSLTYAQVSQRLFRINYHIRYILLAFFILAFILLGSTLDLYFRLIIFGTALTTLFIYKEKIMRKIK